MKKQEELNVSYAEKQNLLMEQSKYKGLLD
jgi:hypothetical protein